MKSRRAGYPEPTWAQFLDDVQARPLLGRLNRSRREVARACYKAATLHFSNRRYARFVTHLAGAAALEPTYVARKVVPQLKSQISHVAAH